jgi:hypothetical protein
VGVWRGRPAGDLGQPARAGPVPVPAAAQHQRPAHDAQGPAAGGGHTRRHVCQRECWRRAARAQPALCAVLGGSAGVRSARCAACWRTLRRAALDVCAPRHRHTPRSCRWTRWCSCWGASRRTTSAGRASQQVGREGGWDAVRWRGCVVMLSAGPACHASACAPTSRVRPRQLDTHIRGSAHKQRSARSHTQACCLRCAPSAPRVGWATAAARPTWRWRASAPTTAPRTTWPWSTCVACARARVRMLPL